MGADYDVIIVGGGLSGLTAAYTLYKKNKNARLLILEARNEYGGRIHSPELKTMTGTARFDLGGQWIGKTQNEIMSLLKELNVKTYSQHVTGKHMAILTPGGKIVNYKGEDIPGSIKDQLDAWNLFRKLQDMCKQVSPEDPYKDKHSEEWNSKTLKDWLEEKGWTQGGKDAVQMLVESTIDVRIDQISLLFLLMYLHTTGGNIDVFAGDTGNAAQAYRIEGGAQTICDALVQRLPSEIVKLNCPVVSVEHTDIQVTINTKANKYTANNALFCIPPTQVVNIKFIPFLDGLKLSQLKYFKPQGRGLKFVMTFKSAFWREAGNSGQITSVSGHASASGEFLPSLLSFDACTSDNQAALVGFSDITCDIPQHRRRQLHLAVISKFYGDNVESQLLDYVDCAWAEINYIGGCVATLAQNQIDNDWANIIRAPVGRLHWAGTETATHWMGYMNGAVDSAITAANKIVT